MANIVETHILVTLSHLVKSGDKPHTVVNDDTLATVEAALEEILELPPGTVIEVGPPKDPTAG